MPYPRNRPTAQLRPIWEINTTPLIDVLLVLLIMMIISIPLAPHSLEIDLPGGPIPPGTQVLERSNKVVVTAGGEVLWNGSAVDEAGLAALLAATTRLKDEPQLQFEPEAQAAYDQSAEVIRQIKQSGVTRFAFVGSHRYREFGKAD